MINIIDVDCAKFIKETMEFHGIEQGEIKQFLEENFILEFFDKAPNVDYTLKQMASKKAYREKMLGKAAVGGLAVLIGGIAFSKYRLYKQRKEVKEKFGEDALKEYNEAVAKLELNPKDSQAISIVKKYVK